MTSSSNTVTQSVVLEKTPLGNIVKLLSVLENDFIRQGIQARAPSGDIVKQGGIFFLKDDIIRQYDQNVRSLENNSRKSGQRAC